jgi:hypothetical protein
LIAMTPYEVFVRLFRGVRPRLEAVDAVRLQQCGHRAWSADRSLVMPGGLIMPLRMLVLGNARRDLLCYSPIEVDAQTAEALRALGTVRWLVAPNRHHRSFVASMLEAFPNAQLWSPVESQEQLRADPPPQEWRGWCEPYVVRASTGFSEAVLFHGESGTLVMSDLAMNIHTGSAGLRRLMKLNGAWRRFAPTRMQMALVMRDTEALGLFYRWAMSRPFTQISVSHGQLLTSGAREQFYQAFHRFAARPQV